MGDLPNNTEAAKMSPMPASRPKLKGPLRAARLCILSVLLPGVLVAVALYMRYHVYGEAMYPIQASDMRLLDGKMSTTWCQGQVVKANASINAFLLPQAPKIDPEPVTLTMTRKIILEDDMKEYWGFYLLQGSHIRVSTCSRWPGGTILVVKGHAQLKKCAYIGEDDSSEELDEIMKTDTANRHTSTTDQSTSVTSSAMESVKLMKKVEHDLQEISMAEKVIEEDHTTTTTSTTTTTTTTTVIPTLNDDVRRDSDSDVGRDSTEDSEQVLDDLVKRIRKLGRKGPSILRRIKQRLKSERREKQRQEESHHSHQEESSSLPSSSASFTHSERGTNRDQQATSLLRKIIKELIHETRIEERRRQSEDKRGIRHEKGRNHKKYAHTKEVENLTEEKSDMSSSVSAVRRRSHHKSSEYSQRSKRSSPNLISDISSGDEEEENVAAEDTNDDDIEFLKHLVGDGIADDRGIFNQTTANDTSNEEFWSSFSSSEEALANCEGVIFNMPLTPRPQCQEGIDVRDKDFFTYRIPSDGYYYFVFASENEIQPNLIRIQFDIEKIVYNVSNSEAVCHNSTDCEFSLDFFSNQKVVMELPVADNETLWNEEYVVVSTCEPRTAIYLGLVIAVPLLILIFAFQ